MQNKADLAAGVMLVVAAAGLIAALVLPGCAMFKPSYCQTPANANTNLCKAERTITSCGPEAAGIFAEAMELVLAQNYAQAVELVVEQGGAEADCIKGALDASISNAVAKGAPPVVLKNYRVARTLNDAYRANHAVHQ